jgi:hypothetical protein
MAGSSYYVATTGNDNNPGTLTQPLATIQAGINKLSPGDILYVRGGTYTPGSTVRFSRPGTADKLITVRSYPGETPVIDGHAVLTSVLTVGNIAWIILDGLTVRNAGGSNGNNISITNATDVTLRNIVSSGAPQDDIRIDETSARVQVDGCDVSGAATGIDIRGRNILVTGCQSHDQTHMVNDGADCDSNPQTGGDHGGQAFAVNETPGPVEIRDSAGWGNVARSICYGTDGVFVELYRSQNVSVDHNRSLGGVVTFETAGDTSGIRLWRNEVWDEPFLVSHQASGMTIANNTVWNTKASITTPLVWFGPGDTFGNGSTAGLVFANNILATASGGGLIGSGLPWGVSARIDHNLYYRYGANSYFGWMYKTPCNDMACWQVASELDGRSIAADPALADLTHQDGHLQATSPAIDRGMAILGITDGFAGAAPDIGRWEYGQATS